MTFENVYPIHAMMPNECIREDKLIQRERQRAPSVVIIGISGPNNRHNRYALPDLSRVMRNSVHLQQAVRVTSPRKDRLTA